MVRFYISQLSLKHKCLIRHILIPFLNAHKLFKVLIAWGEIIYFHENQGDDSDKQPLILAKIQWHIYCFLYFSLKKTLQL